MINNQLKNFTETLSTRYKYFYSSRICMGLMLTLECPVGCRHCISNSIIDSKLSISIKKLQSRIEKLSKLNIYKVINITGGEPFYKFEILRDVVSFAYKKNIHPTVITSAYWASNNEVTSKYVRELKDVGLFSLSVSLDKFHQEKIPIRNIARVINAANKYKIKTAIAFTSSNDKQFLERKLSELRHYLTGNIIESIPTITNKLVKAGRAKQIHTFCDITKNNPTIDSLLICSSMSPIIGLDGSVSCCCGPELSLNSPLLIGNIDKENPSDIHNKFIRNSLVSFIEVIGLRKMIYELENFGIKVDVTPEELHKDNICNICDHLLSKKKHVNFFNERIKNEKIKREIAIKYMVMYGYTDPMMKLKNRPHEKAKI